jgi:glycosyltransferase involved in cell wall biosynthesis
MISVIIPAYNEEKYIEDCLESIFAQQDAPDFEVIVVDNASTDRTASLVKMKFPRAKIIFEPKKSVTVARNRGVKEAAGDILFFVDADIILPRRHFKNVIQKFTKDQKLVAVFGPYAYDGNFYIKFITLFLYLFLALPGEYLLNRLIGLGAAGPAGNLAVKKNAFDQINGFSEKISFYGDDTDIAVRLRQLGKVRFFFDLIVGSSARRLQKEGTLKVLLRYILNILWTAFAHHPFTKEYNDIR